MRQRLDAADLGPPALPWGTTLTLSMALHLLGFFLVVGLPRLLPRPAFTPVYVVDLVSLPGGPAAASPQPAAAAAPQPAAPPAPKQEEKAITIPEPRKNRPEPRKTPAPHKTPEGKPSPAAVPPAAGTAAARPSAAAPDRPVTPARDSGVPGGAGAAAGRFGGAGAAAADAMTFYFNLVGKNIENAWKKPIYPPSETGRRVFSTQIRLTLTSSGRVANVQVLIPSGYEAMDRSVLAAVNEAMFPPFPSSLGYPSLTVPVEIVLTPD